MVDRVDWDGSVVVVWAGEGRVSTFDPSQARCLLVRAGVVSLARPVRFALVGLRVGVFWPAMQAVYYGVVRAFDPEKCHHLVEYEDGEEQWELLGSGELSEYGVVEE